MKGLGVLFKTIMDRASPEARDDLLEELEIRESIQASPAGAILVGMHILEHLGFPQYIDTVLGEEHTTIDQLRQLWKKAKGPDDYPIPSYGIVLSLIVADMIACPRNITPTYKFEEKAEEWMTGPLLGIKPSLLNDDRIGGAMTALGTDFKNLEEVLFMMTIDTAKKADIPLNQFIPDTTLLQLDGEFAGSSKVGPGRGKNSFSQLVVSLAIASGSKLPVGFNVLAGNTSDASTLPDVYHGIDKIADDGPIELLMDRIYPTPSNIFFLKEKETERMVYWISPLKTGLSTKRVRAEIDQAYEENSWQPIQYRSQKESKAQIAPPMQAHETTWVLSEKIKPDLKPDQKRRPMGSIKTREIEVRCVFYQHERKRQKGTAKREEKVQQLEKELEKFNSKLNKRNYIDLEYCKKKLQEKLKEFSTIKKFLNSRLSQSEDGIISFSWTWDTEGLEKEKRYDGVFALLTNYEENQFDANQLITKYRTRDQVEVNFKNMRGFLDLERILFSREERIDTFIFLKVIALFVLAFLRFTLKKEGVKIKEKDLQDEMGNLHLVETVVDPLGIKTFAIARDTAVNRLIRELFNLPSPETLIWELNQAEASKISAAVERWTLDWLEKQKPG